MATRRGCSVVPGWLMGVEDGTSGRGGARRLFAGLSPARSSLPNASSTALLMRCWNTATTASLASGRSPSSASRTVRPVELRLAAAVERLPQAVQEELHEHAAHALGVAHHLLDRIERHRQRDAEAHGLSPARSSVGLGTS